MAIPSGLGNGRGKGDWIEREKLPCFFDIF